MGEKVIVNMKNKGFLLRKKKIIRVIFKILICLVPVIITMRAHRF